MARKDIKYWRHTVKRPGNNAGIVDYCARHFPILGSKSAVKKAIAAGRLQLNGKDAKLSDVLQGGDRLVLQGLGLQQAKKFDVELEIVYEDDWLLVVNKPGGIAVNGTRKKTVENAVAGLNHGNVQPDALPRPVAVHRIDVPTSGLVLLARTKSALIEMSRAFQENQVQKEYWAVVHGKTPERGVIDLPIQDKQAVTQFTTLETVPSRVFGHLSLVRLQLLTGRTHQLRIHLSARGHFIVGDQMYAKGRKTILGKGVFLCAYKMRFRHPQTGAAVDLEIEPPAKFSRILQREKERFGN